MRSVVRKIWQFILSLFGRSQAQLEREAQELADELNAAIAAEERRQIRAAYVASDIQTKRKVALDRIEARLDRRFNNSADQTHDYFYQKWSDKYDKIEASLIEEEEKRRDSFEMARYKASDTAKALPLRVGDRYRQGTEFIDIVFDFSAKLYGYKVQTEERPRVMTRDIEILAKSFYFDFPAAERVN